MNANISRRIGALGLALGLCAGMTVIAATPAAAVKATAAISLRGPASGTYGTTIQLQGVLWRYRTSIRIPGATVYLQRATHGQSNWTTIKSTRTARSGTFAFSVLQGRPFDYRARWGGSSTYTTAVSGRVYPAVAQKVIVDRIFKGYVGPNGIADIGLRGRVYPVPPFDSSAVLQRWDPSQRRWVNIAIGGTQHHLGRNVIQVMGKAVLGRRTYRVKVLARGQLAAGYTPNLLIPAYRHRGLFSRPLLAEGATGTSAQSRWTVTNDQLINGSIHPGTQRWVEVNTSTCDDIFVGASAENVTRAPHISVVADGRQLFAGPMHAGGANSWDIHPTILYPVGARRARITFTNVEGSSLGHFYVGADANCYS